MSGERVAGAPSPALSRSLQILDRASARIDHQVHQLSALQERATRAEAIAAAALKELESVKGQLAHAHDEIALQRDQIGTIQARAEALQDTTLTMILDLRGRLAIAERRHPRADATFKVASDEDRTPHPARSH